MSLEDAPQAIELFKHKQDGCIKVVLKPGMNGSSETVH
jgi:threonine dehydrogenase-like Zn-dependent dehydrogenase